MSKVKQINIRGLQDIIDITYRYKMEEVIIVNQGAKIAFTNIDNICKSLARDVSELIKFLRRYYGSSFDYKNNIATTYKNDLTKISLQTAIYKFIEDNILCKKCKNPETILVQNKKKIQMICKACSYSTEM
jgi:translation initiation factor 5